MAAKTIITVTDDLDGTEGADTVSFALDGAAFEIDLSGQNAAGFRAALKPWTCAARPVHQKTPRRTAEGRRRAAQIRAWARDRGLVVSGRGRIPAEVENAYTAASLQGARVLT